MKKIMFGAMALISLSVAASAALTSSIPGITVTESSCEDGYIVTSTREGVSKTVEYDSCLSDGIVVLDAEGNVVGGGSEEASDGETGGETIAAPKYKTINGVEYYFPAGYTATDAVASNTCAGGFDIASSEVYCMNENLSVLSDGYLNLTSVSGYFHLDGNQLTNVDGLANLTSVGGNLYLSRNQLTNVDGLANLSSVGGNLALSVNDLINVDGLANLTNVGESLFISSNPNLQDLSGLNNLKSLGGVVYVDERDYPVKLDANSYICQNFSTKVISPSNYGAYPTKSDICNP